MSWAAYILWTPLFLRVHLCQAGLRTLQDLGPEMRLALNADLDEEEEECLEEEPEEEDDPHYKVCKKSDHGLLVDTLCGFISDSHLYTWEKCVSCKLPAKQV